MSGIKRKSRWDVSGASQQHHKDKRLGRNHSAYSKTKDSVNLALLCVNQLQASVLLVDPRNCTHDSFENSLVLFNFAKRLPVFCADSGLKKRLAWAKAKSRNGPRYYAEALFGTFKNHKAEATRSHGHISGGFIDTFDQSPMARAANFQFWNSAMLVQQVLLDPLLSQFSVIVIDDFEKRSLETDTLLSFVRRIVRKRTDLRIVIVCSTESSADFAVDELKDVSASILDCRSTTSLQENTMLEIMYRNVACSNVITECVDLVSRIHTEKELTFGNIALFLPSEQSVNYCIAMLEGKSRMGNLNVHKWIESNAGKAIHVGPAEPGTRNCIIISCVLESKNALLSASFHGISVVIDSLMTRRTFFDSVHGMEISCISAVTMAEAHARARLSRNTVIRLSTEDTFNSFDNTLPSEIQRSDISSTVLQLKALRVKDVAHFDYISSPPVKAMVRALNNLHALGAIDDDGQITVPLGERMARMLPLSPQLSKLLLLSLNLGCSVEALSIVGCLVTFEETSLFVSSVGADLKTREEKFDFTVAAFGAKEGDLVLYLNIFNAWKNVPKRKRTVWCNAHGLNSSTLDRVAHIRVKLEDQLLRVAKLESQELLSCYDHVEILQKCICGAQFANAARLSQDGRTYISLVDRLPLHLHPSSSFSRFGGSPPSWVVLHSLSRNIKHVTSIRSEWLIDAAPHFFSRKFTS